MKNKWGSLLVLLLIAVIGVSGVSAQAIELVPLSGDYEVRVPSTADQSVQEDGSFLVMDFGWTVSLYEPDLFDTFVTYDKGNSVETVLTRAMLNIVGRVIRSNQIETFEINGRVGAYSEYSEGGEFEVRVFVLQMADERYGLGMFMYYSGTFSQFESVFNSVLRSFNANAEIRRSIAEANGVQTCFVSTGQRDTARLRVGPGENRSSIAFLPIDQDFEVTGRFESDNGDVWFQLIKDEAAPASSAAEIWVSQEDVDTAGSCDAVGETSAPPIVPIIPNVGGGGSTGDSGAQPQPVVGAVPTSGTWRFELSPHMDASCQGSDNMAFNTFDYYSGDTVNQLTVLDGGARVRFGSDIWVRSGTNFYTGNLQFSADSAISNGVVYLNVVNSNLMTGTLMSNFTIDGTPCSDTVNVTVRR